MKLDIIEQKKDMSKIRRQLLRKVDGRMKA